MAGWLYTCIEQNTSAFSNCVRLRDTPHPFSTASVLWWHSCMGRFMQMCCELVVFACRTLWSCQIYGMTSQFARAWDQCVKALERVDLITHARCASCGYKTNNASSIRFGLVWCLPCTRSLQHFGLDTSVRSSTTESEPYGCRPRSNDVGRTNIHQV